MFELVDTASHTYAFSAHLPIFSALLNAVVNVHTVRRVRVRSSAMHNYHSSYYRSVEVCNCHTIGNKKLPGVEFQLKPIQGLFFFCCLNLLTFLEPVG